jgi:hypothetical protein
MWRKVETDPDYREMARQIWAGLLSQPPPPPEVAVAVRDKQIERAVTATEKLRARGVEILFVRPPSTGLWLEVENKAFARDTTWDVLLTRTGAPGVHFEDHVELQGLELPEWSHLSGSDAERYTEALLGVLDRNGLWSKSPR